MKAIILTILAGGYLYAADPLDEKMGGQPDHLVPVEPRCDAYAKLLAEKFLLDKRAEYGRMILRPSFSGEFAVSVWGDDYTEGFPQVPRTFRSTLAKAAGSIWYSMPTANKERKQKPIKVTRTDVTIDGAFAVAIQSAWTTMLLKTRYPSKAYGGNDGYTAEFSVFDPDAGNLYGQIWSPKQGLLKELAELGQSLADFCETPTDQRPAKQQTIMKQLEAFTRKAQ